MSDMDKMIYDSMWHVSISLYIMTTCIIMEDEGLDVLFRAELKL